MQVTLDHNLVNKIGNLISPTDKWYNVVLYYIFTKMPFAHYLCQWGYVFIGIYYWQDAAKRQTVSIKFTHRPKISIFAPQGRLVARIHVKFGTSEGHIGPLGRTMKFHPKRSPKMAKISLFGKELPHRDRFLQMLGTFIPPTILH